MKNGKLESHNIYRKKTATSESGPATVDQRPSWGGQHTAQHARRAILLKQQHTPRDFKHSHHHNYNADLHHPGLRMRPIEKLEKKDILRSIYIYDVIRYPSYFLHEIV